MEKGSDGGDAAAESVNCPICEAVLPGLDNAIINSHLGNVSVCIQLYSVELLIQVLFMF